MQSSSILNVSCKLFRWSKELPLEYNVLFLKLICIKTMPWALKNCSQVSTCRFLERGCAPGRAGARFPSWWDYLEVAQEKSDLSDGEEEECSGYRGSDVEKTEERWSALCHLAASAPVPAEIQSILSALKAGSRRDCCSASRSDNLWAGIEVCCWKQSILTTSSPPHHLL